MNPNPHYSPELVISELQTGELVKRDLLTRTFAANYW